MLTPSQKQLIAREFNTPETVFLHDGEGESDGSPIHMISSFIPIMELPFAGQSAVGAAWYLVSRSSTSSPLPTIRPKVGDVKVIRGSAQGSVAIQAPFNLKVHPSYYHPELTSQQVSLQNHDYVNGSTGEQVIVSINKHVSFILLELTSEDALSRMKPFDRALVLPSGHLGEWGDGLMGVYAFVKREDGSLRTRMFGNNRLESPATGSAACALSCCLAKREKTDGERKVNIVQGVEMGRRCEIGVSVVLENGEVKSLKLESSAVVVMEGTLSI
jgi:PhzF family phenazine biosynthesis protein